MTEERVFLDPERISKYLYCAICLEIFTEPVRMRCGHTYCKPCVENWALKANSCPQCRERFTMKTNTRDLLAQNLVAELKVKCLFKGCVWVGALGQKSAHEEKCVFHPSRVSQWMSAVIHTTSASLLNKVYQQDPKAALTLLQPSPVSVSDPEQSVFAHRYASKKAKLDKTD